MSAVYSYKDLLEQQKALELRIAAVRRAEISTAVQRIRQLIAEYQLTEGDLFGGRHARGLIRRKGRVVPPKFRDPITGATWTGRGKAPRWIANQDRALFVI